MNCKKNMDLFSLDVAKAFNCIDHEILFIKMHNAGFVPRVIKWFRCYLTRFQRVCLENQFSAAKPVSTGIAQGTVLGPIMFIFYVNDIIKCAKNVHMSLFADDCVLYFPGNNWLSVHRKIQ